MPSNIGVPYTNLFTNQEQAAIAVSSVFRTDESLAKLPGLLLSGTLDGGTVKIQVLKAGIVLEDADLATDSEDFVDSNDSLAVPDYKELRFIRGYQRLKIENLGANADFTAQLIKNHV